MNTKLKGTCTPNSPNSVCSSLFPDRRPTPCLSVKQVFVEQGISKLIHHRHSQQYSRITQPLAYSSKKKVSYHFSAYKPPIAPSGLQEKLYVPYPGYQVSVLQDEEVPAKRWDPTLTLRQALGKLSIDKEGQRERENGAWVMAICHQSLTESLLFRELQSEAIAQVNPTQIHLDQRT